MRAIFENAFKEIISSVGNMRGLFCLNLCVHIKDNNNSPHGKFHRFLFPFSSKFPDLNFAPYDCFLYLLALML